MGEEADAATRQQRGRGAVGTFWRERKPRLQRWTSTARLTSFAIPSRIDFRLHADCAREREPLSPRVPCAAGEAGMAGRGGAVARARVHTCIDIHARDSCARASSATRVRSKKAAVMSATAVSAGAHGARLSSSARAGPRRTGRLVG